MSLEYHPPNIYIAEILILKHKATSGTDEDICKAVPEYIFLIHFKKPCLIPVEHSMCMIMKSVTVSLGPLGNVFCFLWMLSWAHKQEFGSLDV